MLLQSTVGTPVPSRTAPPPHRPARRATDHPSTHMPAATARHGSDPKALPYLSCCTGLPPIPWAPGNVLVCCSVCLQRPLPQICMAWSPAPTFSGVRPLRGPFPGHSVKAFCTCPPSPTLSPSPFPFRPPFPTSCLGSLFLIHSISSSHIMCFTHPVYFQLPR